MKKMQIVIVCLAGMAFFNIACSHHRSGRDFNFEKKYKYQERESTTKNLSQKVITGKASFYGDEFIGRKTANGEIYSHKKLTAAHKSLPFGTRCRVTNVENNKSVVVRINDRGPFVKNRIIDLSYQAMSVLDGIRDGVINVEIEILK